MTYRQKADKFKELCYKENWPKNKWKNEEELNEYFVNFGGKLKTDMKRKKGYLVCLLQKGRKSKSGRYNANKPDLVAEVPMEFAMKVLVLGGFP